MNIPKKCLITGGCGFLGSNIAAHYLSQGSEIVVIDALFREGGGDNLRWLEDQAEQGKFTFIKGDLADKDMVESAFKKYGDFDYICHLGGQVAMTTSLSDPRRDMLTNVVGSFNVLEATREYSPEAMLAYSSTNKVYGDLENYTYEEKATRYAVEGLANGFDESIGLDFASPYGCSKGAADQYVRDWSRNYGLSTVVFRHSSIYGGRQFSTFDQGWIGWFCRQAIEQGRAKCDGRPVTPFTIAGSGKQVRDVLHAADLIRLYDKAYKERDIVSGQIFNIGGGVDNSLSLIELFSLLERLTNQSPLVYEKMAPRESDQKVFIANIGKAAQMLDWQPEVTAEQGIDRMLQWVRESTN